MDSDRSPAAATRPGQRIAVIGAGVSGLVAASMLDRRHHVTVFEADDRLGGHANTVVVPHGGATVAVDTGFIVYNEPNYPCFTRLLDRLGVHTTPSEMSFGVMDEVTSREWAGTSLRGLAASPSNLVDRGFARMVRDVARFGVAARRHLAAGDPTLTLDEFLDRGAYSSDFIDGYLLPLGSAIWSADPATFGCYPATVLFGFLDNHGLLTLWRRPPWRTVVGGSRRYVEALTAGLRATIHTSMPVRAVERSGHEATVWTASGHQQFDHVVMATHSDTSLALLRDADELERAVLGAVRYQPNEAVLHTDRSLLPRSPRAWAAWNSHRLARPADGRATLTYLMNRLQHIEGPPLCVTLNRTDDIDPALVLGRWDYAHPVFDTAAVEAQARRWEISRGPVIHAGAWWGHGFHEDGTRSGVEAAVAIDPAAARMAGMGDLVDAEAIALARRRPSAPSRPPALSAP